MERLQHRFEGVGGNQRCYASALGIDDSSEDKAKGRGEREREGGMRKIWGGEVGGTRGFLSWVNVVRRPYERQLLPREEVSDA